MGCVVEIWVFQVEEDGFRRDVFYEVVYEFSVKNVREKGGVGG